MTSGRKAERRKQLKKQYEDLNPAYVLKAGSAIAETVISLPVFQRAASVFVYLSTEHEPDTSAIIKAAFAAGKTVYVPKCEGRCMKAVRIRADSKLKAGKLGIPEPEDDSITAGNRIDLSVIPCLSVTREGDRLGHGMGYYDRFLKAAETCRLCLCFNELLATELPCDSQDERMDLVVTETDVFRIDGKMRQPG
ncbi:MAG: 5-formyltetrahydrofolate cyclo-ligase [Solobacterium sp.]|nr:5-formyltetrahydrofolate cyclo-ligase [Solobacterium sp.]